LADPLTRVVGGTQVIREDTKRHQSALRAGRARSATGVGAAAVAGLRCAQPDLLSGRT
jgi:hypothetical protein